MNLVTLTDVYSVHRTPEGDAAALSGMTLTVREGELLCVLGPSGAGKSTLLRVIAGLQSPTAGAVEFLGEEVGSASPSIRARIRHQHIGFLDQRADSALSPELSIRDCIALPLGLRGHPHRVQRDRAMELLDSVGLADRADALPDALSGGERQRAALCAALAHRPKLLLADEPTGELDEESAATLRRMIRELVHAHRATGVIVSHDPGSAVIADRSVRIRDGRVVQERLRGDQEELVVSDGGWVQIPAELLEGARIRARARARETDGGVLLEATETNGAAAARPAEATVGGSAGSVRVELNSLVRDKGSGHARRRVIDGLTASVQARLLTVVSGRSGSGKTTLLRLIAGLEQPDAGSVEIDGQLLTQLDPEQLAALRRATLGYVPQEPAPVAFLSAEENVVFALRLRGYTTADAETRARSTINRVGLAHRARQRVGRLSAGEAQRVMLARALACADGLLIADEPTSRLDEASAASVGDLLAQAAHQGAQTVICASHDEQLIRRADVVLRLGC